MSDKLNEGDLTKTEWKEKLEGMTEAELYKHCEMHIWLSAYAANNPRSDYHFLCDSGYAECARRDRIDIYSKAYDHASSS